MAELANVNVEVSVSEVLESNRAIRKYRDATFQLPRITFDESVQMMTALGLRIECLTARLDDGDATAITDLDAAKSALQKLTDAPVWKPPVEMVAQIGSVPGVKFLERLRSDNGAIVSSNSLGVRDIAEARACGRMYVDADGMGYVLLSKDWLTTAVKAMEQLVRTEAQAEVRRRGEQETVTNGECPSPRRTDH